MFCRLMLVLLIVVSQAGGFTPSATAQGTTYTDPFAYCAAVGAIDAPDARYVGPKMPAAIVRGVQAIMQFGPFMPLDRFILGSSWRCMDGKVFACNVGANLPCEEKVDTSQTPTPYMTDFCQAHPNDHIPAFVTGRATVYHWSCKDGVATPGEQGAHVDARGFIANIWHEIRPEAARESQTLPAAGGASDFSQRTAMLFGLGASATLLGLVLRRGLCSGRMLRVRVRQRA